LATREVDENNLPLYTTLTDNIIASAAALANVDPAAGNTLEITYANNLINKCIQQQQEGFNSHGRVYTRSFGSRVASTGNQAIVVAGAAISKTALLRGRCSNKTNRGTIIPHTPPKATASSAVHQRRPTC
jgi:hypothetical protein